MKLGSIFGWVLALGTGVAAAVTEIDNQKKNKKIEDMDKRLKKLEKEKESE